MITLALYRKLCVVLAVAIFFTNLANYAERWGLIPLFWIAVLGSITAPLAIHAFLTSRIQIRPLLLWCVLYLLMGIVWFYPSDQDAIAFQQLQTRFLSAIFVALVLFLVARPEEQLLARRAIVAAVLLAVGLNLYELFNPLTFSTIPGRSSGLYTNVGQSGAALMLGMVLGYAVVPARLRFPFIVLVGVGILTTFSRASMLGWLLIVLFFALRNGFSLKELRNLALFSLLVVGFVFSPVWNDLRVTLEERGSINLNVLQRLAFFSRGSASDQSASDRVQVLDVGWREFGNEPFTGGGIGAARKLPGVELGTHNIYVALLVDHGILGLFVMPLFLVAILWGARWELFDLAAPFALFLTMWGFFSHNVLEERYILLAVALVASIVASARARAADRPARSPALAPTGVLA